MSATVLAPVVTEKDLNLRFCTRGEFDRMYTSDIFPENELVLLHEGQIYRLDERNPRLWTRNEYYRLAVAGILSWEERVELLEGAIFEKLKLTPQCATAKHKTADALRAVIADNLFLGQAYGLAASPYSEPEPDVMILRGKPDDLNEEHPKPADALLVVEVAEVTLQTDRGKKARIYALAGCQEYWVVNLRKRTLEVYRGPGEDGYGTTQSFAEVEFVSPLAAPDTSVHVVDLLPIVRTKV